MSNLRKHIVFSLVMAAIALGYGCAAQRGPDGGPDDKRGPRIIRITPPNRTADMATDQSIDIYMDELIDPVTVPGSITITPEIGFSTRVRRTRITIKPDLPFEEGQTYVIAINRGITDYRKNTTPRSVELVYSTGGIIPGGRIMGVVGGIDSTAIYQVGLFENSDSGYVMVRNLDLNDDGFFAFSYLRDGAYRIATAELGLSDFPASINLRSYALPLVDSILVRNDTTLVTMQLSPPLAIPQILSADWVTPTLMAITFTTPFGDVPIPNELIPTPKPETYYYQPEVIPEDTFYVDLGQAYSQIGEAYALAPFLALPPAIVDTVGPSIILKKRTVNLDPDRRDSSGFTIGTLPFSEPIVIIDSLMARFTGRDTLEIPLYQATPFTLEFSLESPERLEKMRFLGGLIADESGNIMADSIVSILLSTSRSLPGGRITGALTGQGGKIVVEALDAKSGFRTAYTVTDSAKFVLEEVPPGFYKIIAHEQIGAFAVPFYSGTWSPYRHAAKYAEYGSEVEVRARWDVEGIDINFNVATAISQ